jgi:hypothetical protein
MFMGLGDLTGGDNLSIGYGISADHSTVVGASDNYFGYQSYSWTDGGGMQQLDDLAGAGKSYSYDVSADEVAQLGLHCFN